ncbi:YigZ family protein [Treponema parvum]|uniref:YigZ family protein n=1 Tax=Treponema parvum TaxID=138851 RepID=A0A975EYM0_9SPIR|nr:YigZ family protein [Treponema parvum]QTQ11213.1 YigZ family protein [Treponema parvum]
MNALSVRIVFETVVKNSRFIAELLPCSAQAQARSLLKEQKMKYNDASHVCHAFVIGAAAEILGMSDAGEPPGTAGRPMLDVLKNCGCTNILLTVTRYFGGTLLGTGGLVKAYSDSAKLVLEKARELNAFEELVLKKEFSFALPYKFYDTVKRCFATFHIYDLAEVFQTNININGRIREDEADLFAKHVFDITGGAVVVEFLKL